MRLCSNRPEGFGPHSQLHSYLPTTCFLDVIVTPLPPWIYLAILLVLLPYLFLRPSRATTTPYNDYTEEAKATPARRGRQIWRIVLRVLYYFIIVALVAMISLEIARLVDAELGIGLIPFLYAGIVIAAGLHAFVSSSKYENRRGEVLVKAVNTFYWLMLVVVFSLKVATYVKEGVHSRDNVTPIDRYKVVDEVTDVGVMIFLATVLGLLEWAAR